MLNSRDRAAVGAKVAARANQLLAEAVAPELPADTMASASPFFTMFIPTTREESFFLRMAFTGGSSVAITSVAFLTSIWPSRYVCFFNSSATTAS